MQEGKTMQQVADALGVSYATVFNYCHREIDPLPAHEQRAGLKVIRRFDPIDVCSWAKRNGLPCRL